MTSTLDTTAIFTQYAEMAGAHISVAASGAEAAAIIASIAAGPIKCVAAVRDGYPDLYRSLEEAGHSLTVAEELEEAEAGASALAASLAGGAGIVVACAGIAETGSLMLADDALAPRLLSMLADVCVALLPSSAIVPSLDDAGALIEKLNQDGHRYISMVTGPSRTADIERVLTIGVQGPKALHIIVIEKTAS